MSRDDVVLQRPEDLRFLVPVFHTRTACAGAATAYLLRRIAYRAGAYAPGIQEMMFHELTLVREGGSIDAVQGWFARRTKALHGLGYRVECRRVTTPTPALLDWVRAGRGYRGAIIPTNFRTLHPVPKNSPTEVMDGSVAHAVGLTIDRLDPNADEDLVMIDPWPGENAAGNDRDTVPTTLPLAHRDRSYHALMYYWSGWS